MTENQEKQSETEAALRETAGTGVDLTQVADANLTEPEIEAAIEAQAAMVDPILNEFMKAAAEGRDLWLKKKSLRILAEWVMSLLDVGSVMEQKIHAMQEVITAQDSELTELRPNKRKVWTPGP